MGKRTCSKPDCDEAHRARGLCAKHWAREFGKGPTRRRLACSVCGRAVDRYAASGRRPVCSYACRFHLVHGRDIAEGRELVGPVARRHIQPEPKRPTKTRFASGACAWCSAPFVQDMRVTGVPMRYCTAKCARLYHKHAERQRRGQFTIARTERLAIYERDGWVCQLCGGPVDRELPPSSMWAASLDHIECQSWTLVPNHAASNLRLAHRMCNSLRGDREWVGEGVGGGT